MACYHHNHSAGCGCSTQSSCTCGGSYTGSCGSVGSASESGCSCTYHRPDRPGYTACCRRVDGSSEESCSCGGRPWGCCGHHHHWGRPDWDWDDDDDDYGEAGDVYYGYVLNTILSPGEDMAFTEGYNSTDSGIYPSGGGVTLSSGTYRVSYSGNAQPVGATEGLVYSGAAVTLGGYVFPPSTDVVAHSYDTTASLGRTFVVTVSSPTVLRVTNATQQGISTSYTNFNLVIERIA